MKILLTIHHELDPNSGAPGVTWKLGQKYQKLGHEVQYYSFDNLPHQLPGLVESTLFPEFVANHLSTLSRRQKVDIVDASTGDAWVWTKTRRLFRNSSPLLVTRSHGLEHIMHLENLEEARRGKLRLSWKYPIYHGGLRLWEVKQSLRDADISLFCNHRDLEYAVKNLGVDAQRAYVFKNGIPEEALDLPFEPTPDDKDAVIRIALLATYIPRKGIHYGVPALNKILARYPQVKVSFIGTCCPEAEVYKDFEPAVRDRVTVVPRYAYETLPTLLQGHHIKLFPTLSEGFSVALLDAMSCGLAPITTATPGPLEIINHEQNGILVPPRNAEALEQALERLINDRVLLEQLRQNAHQTAQNYSWTKIAHQNLSIYEAGLEKQRNL